jgi:hypothetical protein
MAARCCSSRIDRRQPVLEVAVEPRQFAQEGVVVIRKPAATSSITVGRPRRSRLVCQSVRMARDMAVVGGAGLRRREKRTVALGEEVRHLVLPIQHALAPHLGGMRGQHGAHQDRIEQACSFPRGTPAALQRASVLEWCPGDGPPRRLGCARMQRMLC